MVTTASIDLTHATQEQLDKALQSSDNDVRVDAACAIGDQLRFNEATLAPAVRNRLATIVTKGEVWDELRFEAAIALCEARDPAGAQLTEVLDDKLRRFDACKALSRLQLDSVRQALAKLTKNYFLPWPDKLVASAACAVLGDKEGARYFERTLTSRWLAARRAMALHLLGELRHPEALGVLTRIIDGGTDPMRHTAIRALGHLGDKSVVARLKALTDSEVAEDVRYALDLLA